MVALLSITRLMVTDNDDFKGFLYKKLQRKGLLYRDVQRMVNQDRNVFGACMLAFDEADGMITGLTRNSSVVFDEITKVIDPMLGSEVFGLSLFISNNTSIFLADTSVHGLPTPQQMAAFSIQSAAKARNMGYEPRVAFLSSSTFGNPMGSYSETHADRIRGGCAHSGQ
jgi:malate dehydrogenase (oxaloacetate-decarboxylating)(NADP+)